jgi:hypothetical protein
MSTLHTVLALTLVVSSIPFRPATAVAGGPGYNPVVAPAHDAVPNEQFGITNVNTSYWEAIGNAEDRSGRATSAGATWDRWPVDWDLIEGQCDGQFTWVFEGNRNFAAGIQQAHVHGLKAIAILRGVPTCYVDEAGAEFIEGLGNRGESAYDENGQILQSNHWAYYVYQVASNFGEHIDAWEILNEPDNDVEWPGGHALDENSPQGRERHLRMLEVAAEVLRNHEKTENDTIILGSPMMGAAVEAARSDSAWYHRLLFEIVHDGMQQNFDAIALHAYGRPWNTYEAIRGVRQFSQLDDKPIWMTETGIVSAEGYRSYMNGGHVRCTVENDKGEKVDIGSVCADNTEMASYVIQQYAYALRAFENGVTGKVFHHQLEDDVGLAWGLFDDALQARPAYTATRVVVDKLRNASFAGDHSDTSRDRQGFYRFDFDRDGAYVSVLWSRSDERKVEVLVEGSPGSAVLWNQVGRATPTVYILDKSAHRVTLAPGTNRYPPTAPLSETFEWTIGGPPLILEQNAPDQDNDNIPDAIECPGGPPGCSTYDADNDGEPDYRDDDSDGDGVDDEREWMVDITGDRVIDENDRDRDQNGIWDFREYNADVDGE